MKKEANADQEDLTAKNAKVAKKRYKRKEN
jgi:hypothetical protein